MRVCTGVSVQACVVSWVGYECECVSVQACVGVYMCMSCLPCLPGEHQHHLQTRVQPALWSWSLGCLGFPGAPSPTVGALVRIRCCLEVATRGPSCCFLLAAT